MRQLSWLCAIGLGVLVSVGAGAQTVSAQTSVQAAAPRSESPLVRSSGVVMAPLRLGVSRTPWVTAQLKTESNKGLPHGVVGAAIGAIAGGTIGYARVQMYCDGADPCNATRSTVTGAVIGAALGALLEVAIRR